MTAPNYRAIVARNQAAVVGITTAGPINTAAPQEFGFGSGDPNGDDNPFATIFSRVARCRGTTAVSSTPRAPDFLISVRRAGTHQRARR